MRVYHTSGQYLSSSIAQMKEAASASVERGIAAIKKKVGQPDPMENFRRIEALRDHLSDDVLLMIDAYQQWDRPQVLRFCRAVEDFGFASIEEPLDARDYEGHGQLAATIATPIATCEMLTSPDELSHMIAARGADFLQADAPRIGGITPLPRRDGRGQGRAYQTCPAFRHGDPPAPRRCISDRGLSRALRVDRAGFQRTAADP